MAYAANPPEVNFLRHVEPDPFGGCWLWSGSLLFSTGYGKFSLRGRTLPAHRAAWEIFRGPIPDGMFVCHRCDVYACANPDHLFLGTPLQNSRDMVAKGRTRSRKGVDHFRAKLAPTDIPVIRARIASGETDWSIAKGFGVQSATIRAVRLGITWSHVFSDPDSQGGREEDGAKNPASASAQ